MGIQCETNHPAPSANNEITTGSGPARTGLWGIYDPDHGYAKGTPTECDINNPPEYCLYNDGVTGILQAEQSNLHGVGGFITGFTGANIALILDGDVNNQIVLGKFPGPGHQFFGVVVDGASGFTEFEYRELDGKVGQLRLIFGDDFTIALCSNLPSRNLDTLIYYSTLQEAYDLADDGNTIESQNASITENLIIDLSKSIILKGGYDCEYLTNTGVTIVKDNMIVSAGSITIQSGTLIIM
jgi:hypothetical protein